MAEERAKALASSGGGIFVVFGLVLFLFSLFWLKTVELSKPQPDWLELRSCGAMARHYPEVSSGAAPLRLARGQAGFIRLQPETWSRLVDVSRVRRVNFQVTDTTQILPQGFPGQDVITLVPGGHVDISANLVAFRGEGCVLVLAK